MTEKVLTLTARVPEHLVAEVEAALWKVFADRREMAPVLDVATAPQAVKTSIAALGAMELADVLALLRREDSGEIEVDIEGFDEDEFREAFEEAAEDWLDPQNGHDVLNDGFTPFADRSDLEVYAYLRQHLPDADCLSASAPAP